VTAGTVDDAAAADIVVVAVMWPDVPQAVEGLEWEGRILIDPTNDFDPSDLDGRTSSEVVAELVAPARVVKTGNTLAAAVLGSDPHEAGGQRVMFLSGDDADAKSDAGRLFEDAGFFVVDLGGLREGGQMQQFGAPLAGHNLIRLQSEGASAGLNGPATFRPARRENHHHPVRTAHLVRGDRATRATAPAGSGQGRS